MSIPYRQYVIVYPLPTVRLSTHHHSFSLTPFFRIHPRSLPCIYTSIIGICPLREDSKPSSSSETFLSAGRAVQSSSPELRAFAYTVSIVSVRATWREGMCHSPKHHAYPQPRPLRVTLPFFRFWSAIVTRVRRMIKRGRESYVPPLTEKRVPPFGSDRCCCWVKRLPLIIVQDPISG